MPNQVSAYTHWIGRSLENSFSESVGDVAWIANSEDLGQSSVFLTRRQKRFQVHYDEQSGPLSLRFVLKGKETYFLPNRSKIVLDSQSYLILNEGRTHRCFVEATPDLESIAIFFGSEFALRILSEILLPTDRMNFEPDSGSLPVKFLERLYANDNIVTPRIFRLLELLNTSDFSDESIVGELTALLHRMMHVHKSNMFEAESLPFAKVSTRLEMFERLHKARDHILSSLDRQLTLNEIAAVAGLSEYHFQRCFTKLFDTSPHQYLTRCRLDKAQRLLAETDLLVTEICGEVGFESLGSFSNRFKQAYGLSPNQFRKKVFSNLSR